MHPQPNPVSNFYEKAIYKTENYFVSFCDVRPPTSDLRFPTVSASLQAVRQGPARLRKVTQASRKNSPASLACKASFLCPMPKPQPFARKTPALLRCVARNCALSLIIARYGGIRLGIALSREVARWRSPRTLTQTNPSLAQIRLSYGTNFLSQSDRIRPNLSQRLFRQSFRPNLTYGQIGVAAVVGTVPAPGVPPGGSSPGLNLSLSAKRLRRNGWRLG
jgi:hypothetical protein